MKEELSNTAYSIPIQAFKKKKVRYPVEDPMGINVPGETDQGQLLERKTPLKDYPGAVSLTEIEVLDAISEGEIEGLITGEYSYVGTIGNLGYTSVTFTPYSAAPNTASRWLRSVYWNEVPVVDHNNRYNFQDIQIKMTNGLPNGSILGQISNELTVSRAIGERLRYGSGFAKTYRIYNKEIKAIEVNVKVSQLSMTNTTKKEYGDTEQTTVQYYIFWRPLFSTPGKTPVKYSHTFEAITGYVSYGYIRNTRINLLSGNPSSEPDFLGWEIKVERTTEDSTNNQIRNQTYIDSLTEIFGDVFTYPNTAMMSSRFSAEYFSQIPNRAYDAKLLKVKVPSNYDPLTKQYTNHDIWDGTFSDIKQWTDNPAWCFYDLLTNKRYGLGNYITEDQVDKWTLYEIGKHCDTLVSDGAGGIEPRFTCNLILTNREDAYKVVNDFASIFRAMTYYFAGSVYVVQDSYRTGIYQFTNANVEGGNFQYASSSRRVRHSVAIVQYNDKNDFYKPAVEYIEDVDAIRKYGIRELGMAAFGCTSRGQALRLGKWALLSETLETESISFVVGLEGTYLRPGDIIQVLDNHKKVQRFGGRTYRLYNPQRILLDSQITGLTSTSLYYFSLLTPSYAYEPSQVTLSTSTDSAEIRRSHIQKVAISGGAFSNVVGDDGKTRSEVNFPTVFNTTNYIFTGNLVWMVEGSGINDPYKNQWDYYRALRIEEQDDHRFGVSAIQYATGKFDLIEKDVNYQQEDYGTAVPTGPTNLQLSVFALSANSRRIDYRFTMANTINVAGYKVYAKLGNWAGESDFNDNTYLIATLTPDKFDGQYFPTQNGTYYFRVYSFSKAAIRSTTYAFNSISVEGVNPISDVTISALSLDEEDVTTTGPATREQQEAVDENPVFVWQVGIGNNGIYPSGLHYRLTAREPSNDNTPSKHIYFEKDNLLTGYLSNLSYEWTLHENINAISTNGVPGPWRNYDIIVEAVDGEQNSSAGGNVEALDSTFANKNGYDILAVRNPPIQGFRLTDGAINPGDIWNTDQWISPEGEIKIKVTKGSFPEDLAGAFVYYSADKFDVGEAVGTIPTTKTITRVTVEDSGNPLVVPVDVRNMENVWIRVAPYDVFDLALSVTGRDIDNNLDVSNIVKLQKRGVFDSYQLTYYAWAEVDLFSNVIQNSNWVYKSAGFREIKTVNELGYHGLHCVFENSLPNTNYAVFALANNISTTTSQEILPIRVRLTDRVVFGPPPLITTSTFFIGVLYNDKQIPTSL